MSTELYDSTELDNWAKGNLELEKFAKAAKTVINNGMDPEELAYMLRHVLSLRPGEWEQALREVESNNLVV